VAWCEYSGSSGCSRNDVDAAAAPPLIEVIMAFDPLSSESQTAKTPTPEQPPRFAGRAQAIGDWVRTLASAGVYATLILTFVGQIARVDGVSMEPTLADHDRLVVNKWIYRVSEPRPGDVVML
jgi:Signal peptidase, peptidase S26